MSKICIPLFPLQTVLFPGGALPLRIFEPRYLDMVSRCMQDDTGFGICLISEGSETGSAAETYEIGTLGDISYFHQRRDGLLGITIRGQQRFRIHEREVKPNQLTMVEVELLPNSPITEIDSQFEPLVELLHKTLDRLGQPYLSLPRHYEDLGWVSSRLSELLPLPLTMKQHFLQMDDPVERSERLFEVMVQKGLCKITA